MNYPSERKSPTRLSADEKYQVYKFCLENHALKFDEGELTFWAEPHKIAKEINLLKLDCMNGKIITSQHVKDSVDYTIGWMTRLDKLPEIPVEIEELNRLKSERIEVIKELENLRLKVDHQNNTIRQAANEIEKLKKNGAEQKLARIRAIVSV